MFNKKLKQEVKELRELVTLLDSEMRWMLYEKAQAKDPNKKLRPPIPTTFRLPGEPSIYDLKRKYRGSVACDY